MNRMFQQNATSFLLIIGFMWIVIFTSSPVIGADTAFDEPALSEVLWDTGPPAKPFPRYQGSDVLTQRGNNQRTGTSYSSGMNQSTFEGKRFGNIGTIAVDGPILAQPLFVSSLNAVFIATATNKVYKVSADKPFKNLWKDRPYVNLGDPQLYPKRDPPSPPDSLGKFHMCQELMAFRDDGQDQPFIGIESTPAIDLSLMRLFVSYRSEGKQRLAGIDLQDGGIVGDIVINDDDEWYRFHRNRASLLVEKGIVYVAFAGLCEITGPPFNKPFHGSIYAFDTQKLKPVGSFEVTEGKVDGGGIWQGSSGIATDGEDNLYFSTGNSRPIPAVPTDGTKWSPTAIPDPYTKTNSVLRVNVAKETTNVTGVAEQKMPPSIHMTLADWFTPYRKLWQDYIDLDLGSAGVVLIPGTRYLVTGGKEGLLYVLNGDELGGYQGDPSYDYHNHQGKYADSAMDDQLRDNVVQKFRAGNNTYKSDHEIPMDKWELWPHIHGNPVIADYGSGHTMFIWPEKDHLKAFKWLGNCINRKCFDPNPIIAKDLLAPPAIQDPKDPNKYGFGMPGGMLSAVIDSSFPGRGVLFASIRSSINQYKGLLYAVDPISLKTLWSNQGDDYLFANFVPPTIAKGKVFLATGSNKVLVYGIP